MTAPKGTATELPAGGPQEAGGTNPTVQVGNDKPLHLRLLDAGIPVVVCKPHNHWSDCPKGCDLELTPPKGWPRLDADKAREAIGAFRPGKDTLAMVGGHGIDVLDVDKKMGADCTAVPLELQKWGCTVTPSGGWHFPVPSTGYGKGDLRIAGKHVGDYVGGTTFGGSRLLCFLPLSTRPKYPDSGYLEYMPWDIAALMATDPPELLLQLCADSGLSLTAGPAKPAASKQQVADMLAKFAPADPYSLGASNCGYGYTALQNMLDALNFVRPGDKETGRHMWALRSLMRATELMQAGCLTAEALSLIEANFLAVKPGALAEFDLLRRHAVANTTAKTKCEVHGG